MSRASKKSRVITPETSPNFLSLPLQAFSLEALQTLQEEVPKQIQKYLALQEKEKQAPPSPVPASEFIDIHDVDRVRLANDDLYMMELWRQRHAQFPQGHTFSKPAPNKRACPANLLSKYPELRFSEKENKLYCLTCVIANGIPGDKDVCFVTEGFDDFKNLKRRADSHFNAEKTYAGNLHKNNVQKLQGRISVINKGLSVQEQVAVPAAVQTQRNQYILTRILAALFWLGCTSYYTILLL